MLERLKRWRRHRRWQGETPPGLRVDIGYAGAPRATLRRQDLEPSDADWLFWASAGGAINLLTPAERAHWMAKLGWYRVPNSKERR